MIKMIKKTAGDLGAVAMMIFWALTVVRGPADAAIYTFGSWVFLTILLVVVRLIVRDSKKPRKG